MYNTDHNCIYMKEDLFLPEDNLDEDQQNMMRDDIYRNDILYIFDLDDYNESEIQKKIEYVYNIVIKNELFKEIIIKIGNSYGITETYIGFMLLFSFNYLYLIHPCICDYILYGEIKEENLNKLKSEIF